MAGVREREGPDASGNDDQNLVLAESIDSVDELLSQFYGRFPYPWRPKKFDFLLDPDFETIMLNQEIGDWTHASIPKSPRIWVAGCGTNQALITALRFPKATVKGTDVSSESLRICAGNAKELGIPNLELEQESINQARYAGEFDYVICTGVIHHNADPKLALNKLARALKPTGVLELMVYNRYRRIPNSVFQKAVRLLGGSGGPPDFESDMFIAHKLVDAFPVDNLLAAFLSNFKGALEESACADALIHPVEHSYTVESLKKMAESCELEMLLPCFNLYNKVERQYTWNMEFDDPELQGLYDRLPDADRWQVTNLLFFEKSPLLWFYFQRNDSHRLRKSEEQVCEEFMNSTFAKTNAIQKNILLGDDGKYNLSPKASAYPAGPPDASVKQVFDLADGKATMREIFEKLGKEQGLRTVNSVRIKLTTSAFPYLVSVHC